MSSYDYVIVGAGSAGCVLVFINYATYVELLMSAGTPDDVEPL